MKNAERMDEIDIAKAIGILCVLVGHWTDGNIHKYIYLFHMPLFFIISGMFIEEKDMDGAGILVKESRLISSYFVYSVVFIIYDFIRTLSVQSVISNLANTITLFGIYTLWFLASLWMAKCILRLLLNINNRKSLLLIIFLTYTICYCISNWIVTLKGEGFVFFVFKYLLWSLIRSGVMLVFLYIGFTCKNYIKCMIDTLKQSNTMSCLVIMVSFFAILPFAQFQHIDYHVLQNGMFVINIFVGVCGFVLVISMAAFIAAVSKSVNDFLVFGGRNSIHYMAFEYFGFSTYIKQLIGCVEVPYSNIWGFVVYYVLASILVFIFYRYINLLIDKVKRFNDCLLNRIVVR